MAETTTFDRRRGVEGPGLAPPGLERELGRRWGWFLALGIFLVVIGMMSLSALVVATMATVIAFGVFLLAGGITQLVLALSARSWRGFSLHLLIAVLGGVVGFLLLARPALGAGVLTLLVATLLLVSGISEIVHAASDHYPGRTWTIAVGVLSVVLGIILFTQFPLSSVWFLGLYIGIHLITQGVLWLALAIAARGARAEAVA
ncbi:MAG TPA: HdeD family acid-resistance protein [Kofleriaceae bacterium]|nr:HdeD family acid-resistance protein [Kofleriaceae bacterium]